MIELLGRCRADDNTGELPQSGDSELDRFFHKFGSDKTRVSIAYRDNTLCMLIA